MLRSKQNTREDRDNVFGVKHAQGQQHTTKCKTPRPHQNAAIRDCLDVLEPARYGDDVRAQCIMACGTGKTLVGQEVSTRLGPTTLQGEPTLALINQGLRAWKVQEPNAKYLVVCSDQTVVSLNADDPFVSHHEIPAPVTTDPSEIRKFLEINKGERTIVFSTYHSMHLVASAIKGSKISPFDCTVVDEAHRTVAAKESIFSTVLCQEEIPSRTRLFLTATPKMFIGAGDSEDELISMDNPNLFGKRAHTLTFSRAVELGLLTDYRLVVAAVPQGESKVLLDKATHRAAAELAFLRSAEKYGLTKCITFHNTVKKAHEFADRIEYANQLMTPEKSLWVHALDGKMPSSTREGLLQVFGERSSTELAALSNCRVLTEGVDVPTLDGIVFFDKKTSEIDIIQALGRAMRQSPTKTIGTILIPIVIPDQTEPDEILASSEFSKVWQVVRALRAHDDRFEMRCRKVLSGKRGPSGDIEDDDDELAINIDGLPDSFKQKLTTKIIKIGSGIRKDILNEEEIIDAARAFYNIHRKLPSSASKEAVPNMPGEQWNYLDMAKRNGRRGLLPGGGLRQILKPLRAELGMIDKSLLSEAARIRAARLFYNAENHLPSKNTKKPVPGMPGEKWMLIDNCARTGGRGLPGGSSLGKLLAPLKNELDLIDPSNLTEEAVARAVNEFRRLYKKNPTKKSTENVPGLPRERWSRIDACFRYGQRGLLGGSSLAKFIREISS